MDLDHVARGAGLLRHDRNVALGERVHQARLAGIGRPGDDDAHAVAQALAPALQRLADLSEQPIDDPLRLKRRADADIALVGEVELGLDQSLGVSSLCRQAS